MDKNIEGPTTKSAKLVKSWKKMSQTSLLNTILMIALNYIKLIGQRGGLLGYKC